MDSTRFDLQSYILPIDTLPQSDKTETLGTVLQQINSCHDPVFIFDSLGDTRHLLGMISAYQTFYRQSYPYTKVISNCYVHPPDIRISTPIHKVLEIMRDTAFYALPVFDKKKKLLGVVKAKDILKGVLADDFVLEYLVSTIRPLIPITVGFDATVKDIQVALRVGEQSRVVVVDDEGQVAGIVTRADIARAFLQPTDKQRFSHRGQTGEMAYDEEEIYRHDEPVRKFMTETVYVAGYEVPLKKVVRDLVDSDFNSVILIDVLQKPVGYFTVYDLIDALVNIQKPIEVPIVFKKPSGVVSEDSVEEAENLLYRFIEKFGKRQNLIKVEMTFKEPKYTDGNTAEFDTTLMVDVASGKRFIAHAKKSEFLQSVRAAIREVERKEEQMPRLRKNNDRKVRLLNVLAS